MDEFTQLTKLCQSLGSPGSQAEAMARQLAKRADQLMIERGQTREVVMAYLLRIVVQGRTGEVPAEFSADKLNPAQNKAANSEK